MSEPTQAPEPTSYLVEGNTYRRLIAERDAYRDIANDLARQLRNVTPADTDAPPERRSVSTGLDRCPFCGSHNVEEMGSLVRCNNCDAEGPPNVGRTAAEAWNHRTALGENDAR